MLRGARVRQNRSPRRAQPAVVRVLPPPRTRANVRLSVRAVKIAELRPAARGNARRRGDV